MRPDVRLPELYLELPHLVLLLERCRLMFQWTLDGFLAWNSILCVYCDWF